MRSLEDKIAVLTIHYENLEKSSSFEDYKKHHLNYIQYLIDDMTASQASNIAIIKYINKE